MRIALGLLIIILALLMGYSASHYKAPEIQADIDIRTEADLASLSTTGDLTIDTDGRHVTLRGVATDQAEKDRILERAEEVWGALGPIDEIRLLEVETPYKLSVVKDQDGKTVLSGVVPSDAARQEVLAQATERFGPEVESDLRLAAGAPEGDWADAVGRGMEGLAALTYGQLELTDDSIDLSGEAQLADTVDQIQSLKDQPLEGFQWAGMVDVAKPTVSPFTFAVARKNGVWQVTGFAPDEASRGQLLAKLQEAAGDDDIEADIQLADGMPDPTWPNMTGAAIGALARLETGELVIADQDVRINGDVATNADLEAIQALAASTPGGQDWQSDLVVLRPTIRPYVVEIGKNDDGTWSVAGAVADEASREALIKAVSAVAEGGEVDAKLQLADGVPGQDWQGFVEDRLAALNSVDAGALRFEDYDVRLEGKVATLDEADTANATVANIDPKISTHLEAIDPTVDAFLDLRLSPDDGLTLNGALPDGLPKEEAAELLGLDAGYEGELLEHGRGDADAWREDLSAIGSYLPEFETVELSLKDGRAAIDGETHAKSDAEQIIDKLTDALDDRWQPDLSIETTDRDYPDGTRRTNRLSGIDEEYRLGFWLPVTTLKAGLDACRERTSLILASNKITFLVGEARLDARARRIINDLSSVAIGCLEDTDFQLEIGGHTDSQGADDMNLRLSQARAEAVRTSLVARGVTADALTARGYGETQPIADNALHDGRSANRRITFKWLEERQGDG